MNIVAVYDFDGTLVTTRDKPINDQEAREADWDGKDWFGSPCSLRDVVLHENITELFKQDRSNPNVRVAVLTGRRGIIAWKVRQILREEGFPGRRIIPVSNKIALAHFKDRTPNEDEFLHEEFFTGDFIYEEDYPKGPKGKPLDNTWSHKAFIIQSRMMHKDVQHVDLWDDRKDHFQLMLKLSEQLLMDWNTLNSVTMHQIFPEPHVINPYILDHCFFNNNGKITKQVKDGN